MKIIGSDYDGTLNHGGIDEEKKDAIKKWRKKGNVFSVVSGRGKRELYEIYKDKDFECDYLVADNGAVIMKPDGEIVCNTKCDGEILNSLCEFLFEVGCTWADVHSDDDIMIVCDSLQAKENEFYLKDVPRTEWFTQVSTMLETVEESEKITCLVKEKFGEFLNPLQNGRCIDIVRHDMNKAKGMYKLASLFSLGHEDIITVGDNINDRDMIKEFRSYAMQSGVEEIKKIATFVTESVADLIRKELQEQNK